MKQWVVGPPAMETELLRDPNRSSYTGDKLDGPPDVPEGSGTPLSSSWRYAFHTLHRCTFCQSPSSWLAWRIWQEVLVEGWGRGLEVPSAAPLGTWRFLRGQQLPQRGLMEEASPLMLPPPTLGPQHSSGLGAMGSLQGLPQRRGSPSALHTKGGAPEEAGADLPAS